MIMSDASMVCKWITDKVNEGRGTVVFSLEDSLGMIGVFIGDTSEMALGIGTDAIEAVFDAARKEAARPDAGAEGG